MGCGIALSIKQRYPEAYEDYMKAFRNGSLKLGRVIYTPIKSSPGLVIANLAGQFNYGRDKRYTDYIALLNCLAQLRIDIPEGDPVYFPYKMGCSNAGGDWHIVSALIEVFFPKAKIMRL